MTPSNSPAPLLPWPSGDLPVADNALDALTNTACYQRDRANAAMQRLRVAVEALDTIRQSQNELAMTRYAKGALAAIGPLPDSRDSLEGKSE